MVYEFRCDFGEKWSFCRTRDFESAKFPYKYINICLYTYIERERTLTFILILVSDRKGLFAKNRA